MYKLVEELIENYTARAEQLRIEAKDLCLTDFFITTTPSSLMAAHIYDVVTKELKEILK